METEDNLEDFNPLPFSLLSPTDSSSSIGSPYDGPKAAPLDYEVNQGSTDGNTSLPSSHVDFLNLVFPPTPEKSPGFEAAQDHEMIVIATTATEVDVSKSLLTAHTTRSPKYKATCVIDAVNTMQPILENNKTGKAGMGDAMVGEKEMRKADVESSPLTETVEMSDESESVMTDESDNSYSTARSKTRVKRSLIFPPCAICTGKASGSHYGAITCEACKGFFRRYLQKKEEYKCTKKGKCEIINRNRGNCSGCRLKKCLALGMSKEKSKLGRYTLTKRTETIVNMNKLQGKVEDSGSVTMVTEENEEPVSPFRDENKCTADYDPESEMIGRKISQNSKNLNMSHDFTELLVSELVQAMNAIMPYGPDVKTKEHVRERHKFHSERYQQLIKLFGRMNTVSKEEYHKLYKGYGIDIDGRMEAMKICCKDMEGIVERYCDFAKHIPGFHSLPYKDQSTLLKVARADFFIIIMNDAFSKEFGTFIGQDGIGYHIEEVADKFLSRELVLGMSDVYTRWQKLEMSDEEKALVAALTLVFTDRCKLENRAGVEKIQYALADFMRLELQKNNKATAQRRFTRIIDSLTAMRNVSELYLKEFNVICKDDIITEELPMLSEFFLEEYDNAEKK